MAPLNRKFLETTRGKVLALLQRGSRTVDEIATALQITDNAVRAHIMSLERDGLVTRRGSRPTGTRPAYAYELTPDALRGLSDASRPVLSSLLGVLDERLPQQELESVLAEVGRRLAEGRGGTTGSIRARAEAAADALRDLGGVVDIEEANGKIILRGLYCPLGDAVSAHPVTCNAAKSMIGEIVQAPVLECCEHGTPSRCKFEIVLDAEEGDRAVA
ncbi:MAG TPA: ArsR family transcriptional regulator [Gemmatimonadaceae bacterium]|nr:ArsR family transcriptional regulator [Gemmatimonadaceae bacterium]